MTFVSYAQNFEDVLLWRALKSVQPGFYIDVGAWHPDTDSVTRAFYDRGWHGINIEPAEAAHRRVQAARPRDINLQLAVAATPGTTTFYTLDGALSGLSTTDPAAVADYAARGWAVHETTIPTSTLAEICRQHAPADIHFLKIDVEGAERAVLEGADFRTHRPWIILLEATEPMTQTPNHHLWEDLVLAAGYRFTWFDGLNRYYLAEEHAATLAPAFQTPPNIFDDFLRAADTEWARRIEQAETRASALESQSLAVEAQSRQSALRIAIAEDRSEAAHLRLARTTAEAGALRALADQRAAEITHLHHAVAAQTHRAESAETWVDAMRGSTSWRVTSPLRRAMSLRRPTPQPGPYATPTAPPPEPLPTPAIAKPSLRAVHQFHSGSAYGDAITNAMILTRDLLRRLGYDSRIFVEHRDPTLPGFLLLDDLPTHDRYVLIVRHSMGHDALPRILALPVAKILIYHNITPPELLEDNPYFQRYAQLGLDQLATIRPAVAATLADSEFNALELRRQGFRSVATCPLLFDIDAMLAQATTPRAHRNQVFTILFVGRIAAAKGQRELVAAFAQFRTLYHPAETRLVLVGRHGGADDPYYMDLLAFIRAHALDTGAIHITGLVSDADLARHYAEADLYVSASKHEGFGVPLIEAMAHGIPVLATASGAVPYTVGDAAELATDASPAALARHMLALAQDPARRATLVAHAHALLPRFSLARQTPILVDALVQAGADRPPTAEAHAALAANARFTIAGHVNGTYSLAEVNRSLALALEAARPGAVRLLPVEGAPTTAVDGIPQSQRAALAPLLARPAATTGPDIVVTQHYPVYIPPIPADLKLPFFFWEETLVPPATIDLLNETVPGILAPSQTVAKALIDSGAAIPVHVLGHAPNLQPFHNLRATRPPRAANAPFTFLHVSSCFPRKGVDLLLAAFVKAFRPADAARLIIKGFPNPHNTVPADLAALQSTTPADIEYIGDDLPAEALLDLYRQADAIVLPTRGEGYNLPAAEALAAGIPLIVTGYGGHMDTLHNAPPGAVRLLTYRMAPSATHLATPFSLWAEPDAADLAAALREAVQHPAKTPWSPPTPDFTPDIAARLAAFAADLLLAPPRATTPPTIAWVTTWDVRCGVAEYARHLIAAVPGPPIIFADLRVPHSPAGAEPQVIPSWQAGEPSTIPTLASAISRHDPAIVIIQQQPGLLHWDMLASLLTSPALQDRIVLVTLHNTRHLQDTPPAIRADVLSALASISRVVVHTLADVNFLATIGLAANVTLIPQGAPQLTASSTARSLAPSDPVTIGCYGFFLPDKGIPELIQALALLRRRYPGARLRLVNAEYPHPLSATEINTCRDLATAAGLIDHVDFMTNFLDHSASRDLLAACDLVVLPYQRSKEASSAALRTALSAGIPVATTPLPIFDEAAPATIRLPGATPADIAAGLAQALDDSTLRATTAQAATLWLAARSWTEIGQRWTRLLQGLVANPIPPTPHLAATNVAAPLPRENPEPAALAPGLAAE